MVVSILRGAHIVRVHDVRAAVEAAAVADAVLRAASQNRMIRYLQVPSSPAPSEIVNPGRRNLLVHSCSDTVA